MDFVRLQHRASGIQWNEGKGEGEIGTGRGRERKGTEGGKDPGRAERRDTEDNGGITATRVKIQVRIDAKGKKVRSFNNSLPASKAFLNTQLEIAC